jgi:hypothetical protein
MVRLVAALDAVSRAKEVDTKEKVGARDIAPDSSTGFSSQNAKAPARSRYVTSTAKRVEP